MVGGRMGRASTGFRSALTRAVAAFGREETLTMTTSSGRKRPKRTTVSLGQRVRPEVRERAEREANRYGITVGAYVTALIVGKDPRHDPLRTPVNGLQALALVGNRTVLLLDDLRGRLSRGHDVSALAREVGALRAEIVKAFVAAKPQYDAALDRLGAPDQWGG